MDSRTSQAILNKVREEQEKNATWFGDLARGAGNTVSDLAGGVYDAFAGSKVTPEQIDFGRAVHESRNLGLRQDAMEDIKKMLGVGLGVGAGARGLVGLHHTISKNMSGGGGRPSSAGSTMLPLPIPAEEEEEDTPAAKPGLRKQAQMPSWLGGGDASSKSGIPWYGPAMLATGLGSLALGWKGVDAVMENRRKAERDQALESARQEFHDALLSQYDKPKSVPKAASDYTFKGEDCPKCGASMEGDPYSGKCNSCGHKWGEKKAELDAALDQLYDAFVEKKAEVSDYVGQGGSNALGQLASGYGMYAGLTSLLTGAVVYDKMKKRSRQAVLAKALQRRDRRKFNQAPTEIFATPEPMPHPSSELASDPQKV